VSVPTMSQFVLSTSKNRMAASLEKSIGGVLLDHGACCRLSVTGCQFIVFLLRNVCLF